MCLSCGCGEPNDNHGDPKHITMDMLEAAAKAAEIGSAPCKAWVERRGEVCPWQRFPGSRCRCKRKASPP